MTVPGYVVPGQIISPVISKEGSLFRKFSPAAGAKFTDTSNGVRVITATVTGKVVVQPTESIDATTTSTKKKKEKQFSIAVVNPKCAYSPTNNTNTTTRKSTSVLPEVGDIVLCRITRLTARQAHAEILVVENTGAVAADGGLGIHGSAQGVASTGASSTTNSAVTSGDVGEGFGGIVRVQDVRAAERDKVKIPECFRPGDIVRASVISLGDGSNYYLSTAANDLGVIFAKSAAGQHMYPIDWQTMKCAVTGVTEPRKCAKPI